MTILRKKISFNLFASAINSIYRNYFASRRSRFGYIDRSSRIRFPILIKGIKNVFLYENTHILGHSIIITTHARFIMKKNSGAAEGLTVVTGNHPSVKGILYLQNAGENDVQIAKDIIIEEDVGMGTNVTLLSGVIIGRGAIIGSGSVIRRSIPPYAIVAGNPAKVIGFKFPPLEIIEHERQIYPENERYSLVLLQENYQKCYLNRIKEIYYFLH